MKRYALIFILLVALDQLAKGLINAYMPDGYALWIGRVISFNNSRHYITQTPFEFVAGQSRFFVAGALGLATGWFFRWATGRPAKFQFWLPAVFFSVEATTQMIDFVARGYAINYMGWWSDWLRYGEIMHLGDALAYVAFAWLFVACGSVIGAALRKGWNLVHV